MLKKTTAAMVLGLGLIGQAQAFNDVPNPWLIRVRGIWVKPQPSSTVLTNGVGGRINKISSTITPEVDLTYFFTENFALELIAAGARHSPRANGTIVGRANLGKVTLWPATLSAQYHVLNMKEFKPYVGAGVNYTLYSNVNSGPLATSVNYKSRVGWSLGAGTDYQFNKNWVLNLDVKKIFLKSRVSARIPGVGVTRSTVTINPWVVGVGVGYRA